jgi:hypothetical protein
LVEDKMKRKIGSEEVQLVVMDGATPGKLEVLFTLVGLAEEMKDSKGQIHCLVVHLKDSVDDIDILLKELYEILLNQLEKLQVPMEYRELTTGRRWIRRLNRRQVETFNTHTFDGTKQLYKRVPDNIAARSLRITKQIMDGYKRDECDHPPGQIVVTTIRESPLSWFKGMAPERQWSYWTMTRKRTRDGMEVIEFDLKEKKSKRIACADRETTDSEQDHGQAYVMVMNKEVAQKEHEKRLMTMKVKGHPSFYGKIQISPNRLRTADRRKNHNRGELVFYADTGASINLIDEELAEELERLNYATTCTMPKKCHEISGIGGGKIESRRTIMINNTTNDEDGWTGE